MSYRTYINGHEWLGNNEYSKEIFEELKRQGCHFDEEKCVYDFEVKDLDGLVKATEKYIRKLVKDNNKRGNFSDFILGNVKEHSYEERILQKEGITLYFSDIQKTVTYF